MALNNQMVNIVFDQWLKDLIVNSISKCQFTSKGPLIFRSSCGFTYSYTEGVPNFRVNLSKFLDKRVFGQDEFEKWFLSYLEKVRAGSKFYRDNVCRDAPIYEKSNVVDKGRVLDVGGQLGQIRRYLVQNQECCSIDPFVNSHCFAANKRGLFSTYLLNKPLISLLDLRNFFHFEKCHSSL